MKNYFLFILAALTLVLCISCNLDNNQGIGAMVYNDQYEESFRSSAIIGISSDNNSLYLKTDKGVKLYTNEGSGAYKFKHIWGEGDTGKTAWLADNTGILIEDGTGEFKIIGLNGNSDGDSFKITYSSPSGEDIDLKSIIDCYTADGKNFTLLFGNKQLGSDQLYAAVISLESTEVKDITSDMFKFYVIDGYTTNLSIIGNKALRYSTTYTGSTNTAKYYYCNDITASSASFAQVNDSDYQKYAIIGSSLMTNNSEKLLAVDTKGRVYIDGTYTKYDNTGTSVTKLPIISDSNRTMFIFNGKVVICGSGVTVKSATNLTSSMTPIMLKGCSTANRYLIMTELSGAYLITMNSDSSSVVLTSLGKTGNTTSISEFF